MRDIHGDKIGVHAASEVYLTVRSGVAFADAALSPAKARKLAKKLRRAADEAEGIEPIPSAYTLRLTEDQAKTLAVILSRVGGTAGYLGDAITARKYADEMYTALTEVGLDGVEIGNEQRFAVDDYQCAIHFVGHAE